MPLFDRGPLQQDGLLAERWGQDGSTVVNTADAISNASDTTVHTVTAGKKLFVTDITVQIRSITTGTNQALLVRDNGTGGTLKLQINIENYTGGEFVFFNLKTPIQFDTDVNVGS